MTQIHIDTTDMTQATFLVLDDTSTLKADGPFCNFNGCSSIKHSFTVRSEERQTVYMSAHTWHLRTYPRECQVDATYHFYGPAIAQHHLQFKEKNRFANEISSDEKDVWL